MSYPEFVAQRPVGHHVARGESATALVEGLAVLLVRLRGRLGSAEERPDERMPVPGQEFKIALGRGGAAW